MREVKCAVCGENSLVEDDVFTNEIIVPRQEVEQLYFDLWHFAIHRCPKCNYASKDISMCQNIDINNWQRRKSIKEKMIISRLEMVRHNRIEDYILASDYYLSIGDKLLAAKCLLQAGDYVYGEAMYWQLYLLDDNEKEDSDYTEIIEFAKKLYNDATMLLKEYLSTKKNDNDAKLLLVGVLQESGYSGRLESNILIESLKRVDLNDNQAKILSFLQKY